MSNEEQNFYNNFRTLSEFNDNNISYLMGRGFYNLCSRHHLSYRDVAVCFSYTKGNVSRAVNFYLTHQLSSGSPTLAPQEQGACKANVPPDDNESTLSVGMDRPQQGELVSKLARKEQDE